MSGTGPAMRREDIEQVFELRFKHGMQPREIGEKFDISRSYVCNLLAARTRKQITWPLLREYQQQEYPELIEELTRLRRENALLKSKLRIRISEHMKMRDALGVE